MVRCELSYHCLRLLIHIKTMSYNKFKGFFLTTGINLINRTLCLTTNNTPKAWLISCQDLPSTWALVNCSTDMCQSDTSVFITLKQQGQSLQLLKLPYLYFTGGLEDIWKTSPWSGVKIKMASQPSSVSDLITKTWKHFITFHQCQIS